MAGVLISQAAGLALTLMVKTRFTIEFVFLRSPVFNMAKRDQHSGSAAPKFVNLATVTEAWFMGAVAYLFPPPLSLSIIRL